MISIIIPVYNAEQTLCKCINSIINQTYHNWEIIAVNDGSTDKTIDILLDFAAHDERIKVVTQTNCGPGLSRNTGIEKAAGEYIVFIDADDYVDSTYLETIKNIHEYDNPDVIFVDVCIDNSSYGFIKHDRMSEFKNLTKDKLIRVQMTGNMPWGGCRKAVKLDLIKNNKIAYSSNIVGEEYIYSFEILDNAKKICFIEEPLYHYVMQVGSQSTKGGVDPWGDIVEAIANKLKRENRYAEYENTINSFSLTATTIKLDRMSKQIRLKELINECKNVFVDYDKSLDIDSLDHRVKIILLLIRLGMYRMLAVLIFLKNRL